MKGATGHGHDHPRKHSGDYRENDRSIVWGRTIFSSQCSFIIRLLGIAIHIYIQHLLNLRKASTPSVQCYNYRLTEVYCTYLRYLDRHALIEPLSLGVGSNACLRGFIDSH